MRLRLLLLILFFTWFSGTANANLTDQDTFLLHYWSFNTEATFTTPDVSLDGGQLDTAINGTTELTTGTGQDFTGENARNGAGAGSHLRFNNPIGSSLTFRVPTTGFENILFSYETRRSNSGANTQYITYTLDGSTFQALQVVEVTVVPTVITLDFSEIAGASDNPNFAIRFEFNDSTNPPNLAGNNRFDNVAVDGTPMASTNLPPVVVNPRDLVEINVGETFDLNQLGQAIFADPENDDLIFSASSDTDFHFMIIGLPLESNPGLILSATNAGEALLSLGARDANSSVVTTSIRVLVYPAPHVLADADFNFTSWSQDAPASTYPSNMIFLQSDMDDPGLSDELLFAYNIPLGDYADTDLVNVGFPYRNNARTRINGLGENGISFINTGRGRDLGGAVVALDTRNVNRAAFSFTAGTELANSRVYAIRAQYRVIDVVDGAETTFSPWSDITLPLGEPIEYLRQEDGHQTNFINLDLPTAMLGESHVQLLFRYYFTGTRMSIESGARDMLRLDNINVTDLTDVSVFVDGQQPSQFELGQNYPNPFNPATTIQFTLPEQQHTRLTVYNMLGQQIATLVDEVLQAGTHQTQFNAQGLSSGVYLYRIEAGSFTSTMRMTLLK